jgi:hypothetical protein
MSRTNVVFFLLLMGLFRDVIAQGEITFMTLEPNKVDAPVTFADGSPVSSGFTGQLYAGPGGTPLAALQPLFPSAAFSQSGYVYDSALQVPGVQPGEFATIIMRGYNGLTWEASTFRGESNPITIQTSGGLLPPAYLVGLRGFSVSPVPEPSTLALMALVGIGLLVGTRKFR